MSRNTRAWFRLAAVAVVATGWQDSRALSQDSDGDGVADASDNCPQTPNTDQEDCDSDGAGNACEGSQTLTTGKMGGFGYQVPASGFLTGVSTTSWPVRLTIRAVGDFNLPTEYATLKLAGTTIATTLFENGASDCPATPDVVILILTATQWNALVAASPAGNMAVWLVGNPLVNATQCANGWSQIEATSLLSPDCNTNGLLDYCELAAGNEQDCNVNSTPDSCDIATGMAHDCNANGIPDTCDIANGTSNDIDTDGIPDSCEDCNGNGLPDNYEVARGSVRDCNGNRLPDSCDIASGLDHDCNASGILDSCDIATGMAHDCDANGIPDRCDIANGTSHDIDVDGIPDSCEDCNENGLPDDYEVARGSVPDCNRNRVPDSCDIASGLDHDCNSNGVLDRCDIFINQTETDDNQNCYPDSCEYAIGDFGLDQSVDAKDLAFILSVWGNPDPIADIDGSGLVGGGDLAIVAVNWGVSPFIGEQCALPAGMTLLQYAPDPTVVTNPVLRRAILLSGRPWHVRDNASNIEMLLIPPGIFDIGCTQGPSRNPCHNHEQPAHAVTLTQAFYLGRTEVTQAQWQAKMGNNPSYYGGQPNNPVEQVSWNGIQGFLSQNGLRLPTEAEWEFACRAGSAAPFENEGGTDGNGLETEAWYYYNTCSGGAGCGTRPVATRLPNALGLHDTLGNVWEWVNDWWGYYPSSASVIDPQGPATGAGRVIRGGSWNYGDSRSGRAAYRRDAGPYEAEHSIGFRVAKTP